MAVLRNPIIDPLPNGQVVDQDVPEIADRNFGQVKLRCVSLKAKPLPKGLTPAFVAYPAYCFTPEKPILRFSSDFNDFNGTAFNRILLFRGRYVAGDLQLMSLGKPSMNIHLQMIEPLNAPSVADFQPPADAILAPPPPPPGQVRVWAGKLVTKVSPDYPIGAKSLGIQGVVPVQVVIGKDGHIKRNLRAIGGPPQLQQAAVDAVRQWVYTPYLLNGEPVEVTNLVNVVFALPGHS